MKQNTKLFFSIVALGQTLGVMADVTLDCYSFDAVAEVSLAFNTPSACSSHCADAGHSVFAARGEGCFCLDTLPSNDKKVDASKCNEACPGYALETCGGAPGYYSVGTIDDLGSDSSSTGSSSATITGTSTTASVSGGTASTPSTTTSATAIASSSTTPSNNTVTVTPSSSSSSSGSASPTAEISGADAFIFRKGATVLASVVSAVAALVALV
ncbi:hypothetical protein J7T55_001621 [Diaporthe amygdali]|uniref:uncharacterized protein n=1 Tax=Phomopsis amygdali TaxID=1214568 RepID=UPI0022FE5323|nr:uncharacterized protein J7T55_001621 [Diaporthe amygdali]KAJ0115211.1 hypothetical protein J7T55_001621 [Diaporthe amygdali]